MEEELEEGEILELPAIFALAAPPMPMDESDRSDRTIPNQLDESNRQMQLSKCTGQSLQPLSNLAPMKKVCKLFPGVNWCNGSHAKFDPSTCSNKAFSELIFRRAREFLGPAADLSKVPPYFIQACYLEHYLHRVVDYATFINKHKQTLSKKSVLRNRFRRQRHSISPDRDAALAENMPQANTDTGTGNIPKTNTGNITTSENTWQLLPSANDLEKLHGVPISAKVLEVRPSKKCPTCEHEFTSEGWYTLGSCGHCYHLQCLLIHAFSDPLCILCKVAIPREFYRTIGIESWMPEAE